MAKVTNISDGPRGAYKDGVLIMANPGETIDADDHNDEWFASARSADAKAAVEEAEAPEGPAVAAEPEAKKAK